MAHRSARRGQLEVRGLSEVYISSSSPSIDFILHFELVPTLIEQEVSIV